MQIFLKANAEKRRIAVSVYLLICFCLIFLNTLCLAVVPSADTANSLQSDSSEIVRKVLFFIEKGQWNTADKLLTAYDVNSLPALMPLREILNEYQQIEDKRIRRQEQIFSERYQALSKTFDRIAGNDPNVNFQDTFRQTYNVWKDATQQQKEKITSQKAFECLMDHARQTANDLYGQGQWTGAYVRGIQWLMTFEPENNDYCALDEKLSQVYAILEFLREDSCEDKLQRYTPIQRQTIKQIFSILQAHYVTALPYDKMADGMRNRAAILADVLKTKSSGLVLHIDPNDITQWAGSVKDMPVDFNRKRAWHFDRQDFEDYLDILLALNDKTLKMPDGFLLSMMTDAALAELDPYTVMVWPFAVKDFDKAITGQFGGIGIHIRKDREGIRIMSLVPDTPAMKAGLQSDAIIVAVDGESTRELSITCAVQKISGPVGTSVALTVRNPGSDTEELITLTRDNIVVPVVEGSRQVNVQISDDETIHNTDPNDQSNGQPQKTREENVNAHWDYFLDDEQHIGYLRLTQFTEQTTPEVMQALGKMESDGLAALILDLRGNGGGLLSTSLQIADLFVDKGFLLQSRGRNNNYAAWPATDDSQRAYPLAILIDGASASASEIVSGILGQSNHRAILVGQRSYGKGSMQEVVDLGSDKGKLKFTSAYYYLPNGMSVANREIVQAAGRNDWGIAPDISVPLYDFERRKIRQINTKRTKVSNAPVDSQKNYQDSIRQDLLTADPQLAIAVLVLKAELAVQK